MTEPSLDPNTDDDTGTEPDRRPTVGVSRWHKVIGGIGLVVVLWVGSEIYDQVSATDPGGPGPGQESPGEPGQEIDPENDDVHDPTQFDHG